MQFMLMIHVDEQSMATTPTEDLKRVSAPYLAYTQAMRQAGIIVGGERLRPSAAATTVRVRDGATEVLDGPYAEAKEQLGGYFLIEVADRDEAVAWAARCPGAATGALEVRAVW